jgi:amidase
MIRPEEVAFLDATSQAGLIRKKEITPTELLEAAIERIERINPKINAVVTPMYDQARAAAAGPLPEGPFTGVPFLLKDILRDRRFEWWVSRGRGGWSRLHGARQ